MRMRCTSCLCNVTASQCCPGVATSLLFKALCICAQVRIPVAEVTEVLLRLTDMQLKWQDVREKYPEQHVDLEKEKA